MQEFKCVFKLGAQESCMPVSQEELSQRSVAVSTLRIGTNGRVLVKIPFTLNGNQFMLQKLCSLNSTRNGYQLYNPRTENCFALFLGKFDVICGSHLFSQWEKSLVELQQMP